MKHELDDINMLRHMVRSEVSPHLRHHFTAALDELAALRERGRCEWKPTAEYGPPIVLGEEMLGHWQDRGYTGIARVSRTAGGVLGWRGVNMHGSPTHLAPLPEAPR